MAGTSHRTGLASAQAAAGAVAGLSRCGDAVRFIELNPVSARLVALLQETGASGTAACVQVAGELQHPDPAAVIAHGAALLRELRDAGALLGVAT
jgi:hypothetical protein